MMSELLGRPYWVRPVAVFLGIFGLITIREGGAVLIGDPQALAAAGRYVPFVVWLNALAGIAYVATAAGLWRRARWAAPAAALIAAATVLVFAALGLHIAAGYAYELRTVIAMALRSAVWVVVAWLACRSFGCSFVPRAA